MTIEFRPQRPEVRENWLQRPPWYQRDYFELLVGQELYRSRRYGIDTSLILIRMPAISRRAARALYTYVSTQLREIDCAGMLGTGDYMVCLPHTPASGAEVVSGRLRTFLDEYAPLIGAASFGKEDGEDFEGLLVTATGRLS